jgi:hypothetical protein
MEFCIGVMPQVTFKNSTFQLAILSNADVMVT